MKERKRDRDENDLFAYFAHPGDSAVSRTYGGVRPAENSTLLLGIFSLGATTIRLQ